MDQEPHSVQESVIDIGEIARDLVLPFSIGLGGNFGNLDSVSLEVHDHEHASSAIRSGAGAGSISEAHRRFTLSGAAARVRFAAN